MRLVDHLAGVRITSELQDGQLVVNTFHFRVDETLPNEAKLQGFVDGWSGSDASDDYLGTAPVYSTLRRVDAFQVVVPLSGSDVPIEVSAFPDDAFTGGSGTLNLPDQACALLRLHTGFASRRARGHNFLPPSQKADQLDGSRHWASGGYLGNCQNFAATVADQWLTGQEHPAYVEGMDLCVFSHVAAMEDAATDDLAFRVTSLTVDTHVHWLRSRQTP